MTASGQGIVKLTDLGFDEECSSKEPFASVCVKLAAEFQKDGFVTDGEPLRVRHRQDFADGMFSLGFVKGLARASTMLAYLLLMHLFGQCVSVLPNLHQLSTIHVIIE